MVETCRSAHTRTHKHRQSSLIKNDVVSPLLSNSSYRNRIFMGVYLSHFCWHKHAAQQRRFWNDCRFLCHLTYLSVWEHRTLFFWCLALHRGPIITVKSWGLIVARRPVVTHTPPDYTLNSKICSYSIDIILLWSGSGQTRLLWVSAPPPPLVFTALSYRCWMQLSSHSNNKEHASHTHKPARSPWTQTSIFHHVSRLSCTFILANNTINRMLASWYS